MARIQELQTFLDATRDAFAASGATPEALAMADKVFGAADATPGEAAVPEAVEMPACEHLQDALDRARGEGGGARGIGSSDGGAARGGGVAAAGGECDGAVGGRGSSS